MNISILQQKKSVYFRRRIVSACTVGHRLKKNHMSRILNNTMVTPQIASWETRTTLPIFCKEKTTPKRRKQKKNDEEKEEEDEEEEEKKKAVMKRFFVSSFLKHYCVCNRKRCWRQECGLLHHHFTKEALHIVGKGREWFALTDTSRKSSGDDSLSYYYGK